MILHSIRKKIGFLVFCFFCKSPPINTISISLNVQCFVVAVAHGDDKRHPKPRESPPMWEMGQFLCSGH